MGNDPQSSDIQVFQLTALLSCVTDDYRNQIQTRKRQNAKTQILQIIN